MTALMFTQWSAAHKFPVATRPAVSERLPPLPHARGAQSPCSAPIVTLSEGKGHDLSGSGSHLRMLSRGGFRGRS